MSSFSGSLRVRGLRAVTFSLFLSMPALVGGQETVDDERGAPESPIQRVERIMAVHMDPVVESPEFQARMEGMDNAQANSLGYRLTSDGVLKLSDRHLVRRVQLLARAIASVEVDLCAAQLVGGTHEQSQLVLASLPDEALLEFAQISAAACQASLEGAPTRQPSADEVRQAFEVLMAAMSDEDRQRFRESMGNADELDYPGACWTVRTMYQTATTLSDAHQALVARMLAVD